MPVTLGETPLPSWSSRVAGNALCLEGSESVELSAGSSPDNSLLLFVNKHGSSRRVMCTLRKSLRTLIRRDIRKAFPHLYTDSKDDPLKQLPAQRRATRARSLANACFLGSEARACCVFNAAAEV